MVMQQKAIVKP